MLLKNKALLVIFVTTFVDLLGFGLVIPILPLYAKDIGASDLVIGMLIATYSAMQFSFASFWGSLSDRYGRRPIILISCLIMMGSYLIFSYADTLLLLFLARALSGIGGGNISVAQAYVSDIIPVEKRARAFAIIGASFGLGFVFGPVIGGFIFERYGFESVGYGAGVFSLINVVLAYFFLHESLAERDRTSPIRFNPFGDIFTAFKRPVIKDLMIISFTFLAAFAMMQGTAALLWNEVFGLTQLEVGWMFTFIGLMAALIQGGLIGTIANKVGENTMLISGNILIGVGLLGMPFTPPEWFIPLELICLACMSLGMAFLTPTISSMLSRVAEKKEQGKMLGINQSMGSMSRVIGPVAGGGLYGLNFHLPYLLGGVILMGTTFLSIRLVKKIKSVAAGSEDQ